MGVICSHSIKAGDGGFDITCEAASSVTRSGISGGAVVITDETEQQKCTGQTAEQTVASLNRCYR
ncbi:MULTISPECIES: hypothetical protein [Pseudomonas syringae group genomosp. 2]|uniref:hypothetical protein n=1 Tax=Pseudomonas syringae group genomosp. 2 TaxID=251698 RepID=UPI0012F50191|nr:MULTISPECIES: hypothetical protein [Pseudomonas syringae group genomosp. 2]MCQ3012740.1 hypothetical protein [Pseudomonas savastanoi]